MKRGVLVGKDAYELVSKYVPIAKHIFTKDVSEAVNFSKKTGFPLVLKIISKQAIHKTDIKGVRVVNSFIELSKSFHDLNVLSKKKKFKLDSILVQEYVKGREVIIGLKKDDTFGHVILFGLGGILVETLKDVSFRVCPITLEDAKSMIEELKLKNILYGVRGEKPVDFKLLTKVLVDISKIPDKYPLVFELDINPFMIDCDNGKLVDVRVVF